MGLLDDLRAATVSSAEGSGSGDFADSWRPKEPEEGPDGNMVLDGVEGTVLTVNSRAHENHPDGYPIVTLQQEDGTAIAVHGLNAVLKGEFQKQNPQPGDMMAVVYDGQGTTAQGRHFKRFRVRVLKQSGKPIPPAQSASPAAPKYTDTPPF